MNQEKKKKSVLKEFFLTSGSVNNGTTIMVLTFIIVTMGLLAYVKMPKENFPEVKFPTIYIGTPYPGNSPEDIENLITRPLEKELNSIANISKLNSNSVQDYSTIVIEFSTSVDPSDALQKVKDAVDKAKKDLPKDLDQDPSIFEMDVSEFPVMNINLSGDYSNERLKEYAEYLEDEIEKLPEITRVEKRGLEEKEVKINIDVHKMEALQVTFYDVQNAVASENVTISGGNLLSNGNRKSIRVVGEFEDPSELENIIVKHEKQNIVYLRDIVTDKIGLGYKEKESFARLDGKPVVMLDIIKRSGGNLIEASNKIDKILAKSQAEIFPDGLKISKTLDQSDQTKDQVSNLENNIISGVILVTLVLLFFLGTRNALFVGMAIPLSMFMSFLILGMLGISINMMVLFGLIMGLGMLVDNGIVVVENVVRLREDGYSLLEATKYGVGEVAWPIISSTATTLAAFLPLAFWPGIMGEFMLYLPVTLIVSLGSSLFVALVINPVFLAKYVKLENEEEKINTRKMLKSSFIMTAIAGLFLFLGFAAQKEYAFAYRIFGPHKDSMASSFLYAIGNLLVIYMLLRLLNVYFFGPSGKAFREKVLPVLENRYEKFLSFALRKRNPLFFFLGTFIMLFFSIGLMNVFSPLVRFFPANEPQYVNVFVEFPIGTDVEVTNSMAKTVEKQLETILTPYRHIIESVVSHVGVGTSDPNDPTSIGASATPNKARITVSFLKFRLRDGISTLAVMEEIREKLEMHPGVSITVDKNRVGPPTGKPLNIEVTGPDYAKLISLSDTLKMLINNSGVAGIEELKTDFETGKPELLVNIDREKARRFGVSTQQIAMSLRTALFGSEVSKYKVGEDDYPIQLRLSDYYRYDVDALMNQHITFRDPSNGQIRSIPISALATVIPSSSLGSVKRKDLSRVVTIYSNINEDFNATKVNEQVKAVVADFNVPNGYDVRFTGEQEKQAEEMGFLLFALTMAVFMIFLIIVAQFNRISAPFIIMTSVLFSLIGVFLGLIIFQMEFIVMMTMIGIISLAGIVVNNAIVLIDFIELMKERIAKELNIAGPLPKDILVTAIVNAGKTRLRPVLLTAITTVLGLIPLAIGLNVDFIGLITRFDPDFYMGGDNVMFWGPMSWTIIFGLTFATFLTLVLVPVMYLMTESIKRRLRGTEKVSNPGMPTQSAMPELMNN